MNSHSTSIYHSVSIVDARNYGNYTRNLGAPSINIWTDKRGSLGARKLTVLFIRRHNWRDASGEGRSVNRRPRSRFFFSPAWVMVRATWVLMRRGASGAHCPVRQAAHGALDKRPRHGWMDRPGRWQLQWIIHDTSVTRLVLGHVSSATVPSPRSSDLCFALLTSRSYANHCRLV